MRDQLNAIQETTYIIQDCVKSMKTLQLFKMKLQSPLSRSCE